MASASTTTTTQTGENGQNGQNGQTIPITLQTSSSSISIPNVPYLVPSNWKRSHLSTLVNRVLNSDSSPDHKSIPFDFIINGKFLRGTLHNYLTANGLNAEQTLDLHYLPSTLPPTFQAAFQQDDWISAVDASRDGLFLTSSYDSTFRIFSSSNVTSPLLTFSTSHATSPNPSLTTALWVPSPTSPQGEANMVTGGMDGLIRFWNFKDLSGRSSNPDPSSMELDMTSPSEKQIQKPHLIWSALASQSSSSITSLDVSKSGKHLLSSSVDGCISLFDTSNTTSTASPDVEFIPYDPHRAQKEGEEEEEEEISIQEERSRKKRKLKKDLKKSNSEAVRNYHPSEIQVWHVSPDVVNVVNSRKGRENVPGRNSRVSKVLFSRENFDEEEDRCLESVFSAGWDGCVKEWDFADGGRLKASKSSDKVLLCMDQLLPTASSASTLVTGNMDRSICLWDMRSGTTNISLQIPSSHLKPVSSIKSHPKSPHLFSSGSHDGIIKVWDVRSPKQALFSLNPSVDLGAARESGKSSAGADKAEEMGMHVGEGQKVLAMDWSTDGQMIVSGGEDKKLSVWKGEGIGKSLE